MRLGPDRAAIGNAVCHDTGKRNLPITIDKL